MGDAAGGDIGWVYLPERIHFQSRRSNGPPRRCLCSCHWNGQCSESAEGAAFGVNFVGPDKNSHMPSTVFVSSTFVDLQSHRKATWEALQAFDVNVRGMEQFGARTETPLQTCIAEVEQSDIYVGIIGFRLGSIEPTSGKSYTQLEYERALALSKYILVYLIDEQNAKIPRRSIDVGESLERLDVFKKILRERHTIDTFVDEADLVTKLSRDLQRHALLRAEAPSHE